LAKTKKSAEKSSSEPSFLLGGWRVFAHPLFLDQFERLSAQVEALKKKSPKTYRQSADAKVLAGIFQQAFVKIPEDPSREEYRQGDTLGKANKHWFRAKFGNGRFRLFFRYSSAKKTIILAWVNDQESLRTYDSKTDAYAVFRKMLADGEPPDDWPDLEKACVSPKALGRLKKAAGK
jgi:toxin YhaV